MKEVKVFISYSHSSDEHENKILEFAEQLSNDGIIVFLDKWDLSGGKDLNTYMEQKILEADKVIVACDKKYKEKANNRVGGAGTETLIISSDVYEAHDNTKYIPVIFEKDRDGNAYVPTYMKGRFYYDLSDDIQYPIGYEDIVRDLYEVPKYKRPKLGNAPKFITEHYIEDSQSDLNGIYSIGRVVRHKLDKINHIDLLSKFKCELFSVFDESLIPSSEYNADIVNVVYDKIVSMEDVLITYCNLIELLVKEDELSDESIKNFFEEITEYYEKFAKGENSREHGKNDHFLFIGAEFFVYTIMILRKYKKYSLISNLLKTKYYVNVRGEGEFVPFTYINQYLKNFDYRKATIAKHRVSIHADLLVARANKTDYGSQMFIETELYLAFYSELNIVVDEGIKKYKWWFPRTHVLYEGTRFFKELDKVKSNHYLNLFLKEYDVNNKDELKSKAEGAKNYFIEKNYFRGYSDSFISIPYILDIINFEDIGTIE
ncbi:TIR domain-containing protein [Mycoplasmatota bacterium WC44]